MRAVIFAATPEQIWPWLAILYKTLLDAPAGFASFRSMGSLDTLWTIEIIIALFGLIGLWGTIQISRRYLAPEQNTNETGRDPDPMG